LKEKEIVVSFFKSKPEDLNWSNIKLVIKTELLLLFIKKGSDRFKVAVERDLEPANNGINKYILSSPINLMKDDISSILNPSK
jgi:hypothetical protein